MTMYQELHRWEDAIAVAEARVSVCNPLVFSSNL